MDETTKKRLLLNNGLFWLAAIVIPPILHALPASHPPKILPLFIYSFWVALAVLSTWMWSKAINTAGETDSQ